MLKVFKFLKWYHWLLLVVMVGFIYLQVRMDLILPEKIGNITTTIFAGVSSGQSVTSDILNDGLIMLLVSFISIASTIIASFIATRVGTKVAATLRHEVYGHVQDFSLREVNHFSTPSLITRTTNDVQQVQMALIIMLRMLVTAPITAVSAIFKVVNLNVTLTMVIVLAVSAIVVQIIVIFSLVGKKFGLLQTQIDDLNQITRETLTGIRVVRAHNAEDQQSTKFDKVNTKLTKTQLFVNTVFAFMNPGMMIIMNSVSLGVVAISAVLLNNGTLGTGPVDGMSIMIQFTNYGMMILFSFMMLIMLFIFLPRAIVSAKRIMEVIETPYSISEDSAKAELTVDFVEKQNVSIEFKNVSFRYPHAEEDVIKNVSFKANRGQTLAFIGSTGSGKSTIIQLLLRFYDVTDGEILINGENIKNYPLHTLYQLMGYVPQKGLLFSGDITSNLQISQENATDEEMYDALDTAQIKHFVDESEDHLHHRIDQGGNNVSGGQKQRLSIARALIRNPKILIFDDSFSALDYRTDKSLRDALKHKTENALKVIVGQRIGTIMDADQIIVLEKGETVGIGTHKELLADCTPYQQIAFAQLSKEELARG
ncbi:MAG: ABC transporter ATP-binding protein [Candidatus Izemoplasmatales bacterium]